jgi:hypothetical protein
LRTSNSWPSWVGSRRAPVALLPRPALRLAVLRLAVDNPALRRHHRARPSSMAARIVAVSGVCRPAHVIPTADLPAMAPMATGGVRQLTSSGLYPITPWPGIGICSFFPRPTLEFSSRLRRFLRRGMDYRFGWSRISRQSVVHEKDNRTLIVWSPLLSRPAFPLQNWHADHT